MPFDEILEVSDRAVDLTRLNAGAPALDSHSVWSSHSQVGVVERAWIEGKEGKAILAGKRSLDDLSDYVLKKKIEPQPKSGKQEYLEDLLNSYL